MSPSRIFILRPVATSLMMAGVVLVGVTAFRQLPVSALPQVDYPTMQIQTFYPGASPEVVTSSITAPLEKQFGQVPGLTQMTSISSFGSSLITLQFSLDLSIDVAEQEVQAAINAATTFLPTNLPVPPIYSKTNPADAPILTLAITSSTVPLPKVEELAETRMAQRISQLQGVGLVSISGGQRPAVRVQANPTALASYGLSLEALRTALGSANVNQAKGNFDGPDQAWTINDNDQLQAGAQYGPIIIAYRNGAPVRIRDVATVIDGAENTKLAAWVNADRGHRSEYSAAARDQHHQRRRYGAGAPSSNRSVSAGGDPRAGHHRPHHHHPGIGEGRRIRTDAHHRAGRDGHLSFPAQRFGHHHPRHRRASFAGGHVRRHVPAGVQPG